MRHVPPELVEKILLNLPVKSLLRFAAVSKSWRGLVHGGGFRRKYRGRQMIVLRVNSAGGDQICLACPLSSLSTDNAPPFDLPFEAAAGGASCGELRCFEAGDTLCLYNPATRAWRKLPTPSCPPQIGATVNGSWVSMFIYGLGYDSSTDDYKILKIPRSFDRETELYSLRSNRWRKIDRHELSTDTSPFITTPNLDTSPLITTPNAVFVGQKLHWLVLHWDTTPRVIAIHTFDVSTEKYGIMEAPRLPEQFYWDFSLVKNLDVLVLRGKLSVCMNHSCRFVVWVMEDDGRREWKKDLEIDYASKPFCYSYLRPLYFYNGDNGRVIKAVTSSLDNRKLFICKEEEEEGDDGCSSSSLTVMENGRSFGSAGYDIVSSFTYVESLVSLFPDPYIEDQRYSW